MVVKSATKKKLTDLGVDEEHAHIYWPMTGNGMTSRSSTHNR